MNSITMDGGKAHSVIEDKAAKLKAIGWHVFEACGHRHGDIDDALVAIGSRGAAARQAWIKRTERLPACGLEELYRRLNARQSISSILHEEGKGRLERCISFGFGSQSQPNGA